MTHLNTMKKAGLALAALLMVAVPATAALPILNLGSDVATPAGTIHAATDAPTCVDLATPPLPAVPVPAVPPLPLPVPVPIPAVPAAPIPQAGAHACAQAGLDGVSAEANAYGPGVDAGIQADAETPAEAEAAVEESKGFLESLKDLVFGWF